MDFWGGIVLRLILYAKSFAGAKNAETGRADLAFSACIWCIGIGTFPQNPNLIRIQKIGKLESMHVAQISKQVWPSVFDRETVNQFLADYWNSVTQSTLQAKWLLLLQPIQLCQSLLCKWLFQKIDIINLKPEWQAEHSSTAWNHCFLMEISWLPQMQNQPDLLFCPEWWGWEWGGASFDPNDTDDVCEMPNQLSPWSSNDCKCNFWNVGSSLYDYCGICHGLERKGNLQLFELIGLKREYSPESWSLLPQRKRTMPAFDYISKKSRQF